MTRTLAARLTLGALVLVAGGCSPGTGNNGAGSLGDGANGGTGSGAAGNGSGNGASVGGQGGDPQVINVGGTTGGDTDAGCQETTSKPEQVTNTITISLPLDMFIMYDQSGSMAQENPTKWDSIKTALTGFVSDPASDGIGVGIQYFPLTNGSTTCNQGDPDCLCLPCCFFGLCLPGCPASGISCVSNAGGSCLVSDYATPDVPIQLLPGVSQAIISSLNAHAPGGGTPTEPALQGALQYAAGYAATHLGDGGVPYRKTIVVLATDGNPNDCSSDVAGVSAIAAQGLAGNPSIQTFVIGVGSSLTSLDAIAQAGGTNKAFIVDTAGDPAKQFLDAMNQIRTVSTQETVVSTPVPCEWKIPQMPGGQTFDKDKVYVNVDGAQIAFTEQASCANVTQNAWYYDDPNSPTKVLLCSNTCDTVKAEANPVVNVVFGCTDHEVVQ